MTGRTVWSAGMYGSASTWLFNVVRQIHQLADRDTPQTHFFSEVGNFATFDRPNVIDLVKSHEISDEATIIRLAARSRKIFVSIRDPRDAVTSLMLSHKHSFERALFFVEQSARLCAGLSHDRRAALFVYETGFFDDPRTVEQAAAHLGYRLTGAQAEQIFAANTRPEVEKYIAGMPGMRDILRDHISGDLLDTHTQWHTHHAGRSGEIGRWRRELSAAQAGEIVAKMPFIAPLLLAAGVAS